MYRQLSNAQSIHLVYSTVQKSWPIPHFTFFASKDTRDLLKMSISSLGFLQVVFFGHSTSISLIFS